MPITSELDNVRKFKGVGFTEEQSEVLAEALERSTQQGFDRFVEIFERGIGTIDQKIDLVRAEIRAELQATLREQMLRFITILAALLGLAVAVIKLFPNWY